MDTPSLSKFQQAVTFASENLISEAATTFREVVERWPDDDLADDALYNIGACYLAMNQFGRAADTFRQVIHRYPNATIHVADGRSEVGRTAAKAWLGLVAANLGLGSVAAAKEACDALEPYSDSMVVIGGMERPFHDIGCSLLAAAIEEREAEEVTQADVVDGDG